MTKSADSLQPYFLHVNWFHRFQFASHLHTNIWEKKWKTRLDFREIKLKESRNWRVRKRSRAAGGGWTSGSCQYLSRGNVRHPLQPSARKPSNLAHFIRLLLLNLFPILLCISTVSSKAVRFIFPGLSTFFGLRELPAFSSGPFPVAFQHSSNISDKFSFKSNENTVKWRAFLRNFIQIVAILELNAVSEPKRTSWNMRLSSIPQLNDSPIRLLSGST